MPEHAGLDLEIQDIITAKLEGGGGGGGGGGGKAPLHEVNAFFFCTENSI